MSHQRCGYVALIGRPNVGKSTLLNRLLEQKISIVSRKPQTTRHRVLGIKTDDNTQVIYVDTPGLHAVRHNAMNRYLNRTALSSLNTVDVILWLVQALQWTEADDYVLALLTSSTVPVILAVNKIDKVKDKTLLLPYLQVVATKRHFTAILPLSARNGTHLTELNSILIPLLPVSPFLFAEDQITNRSERFLVAEFIREQLIQRLGAELPYRLTVQIEYFASHQRLTHISALIWVERESQKAIVIGKQGSVLKAAGEAARVDIETLLASKVFLQLWVKVKEKWCDDERALQQLGYTDENN